MSHKKIERESTLLGRGIGLGICKKSTHAGPVGDGGPSIIPLPKITAFSWCPVDQIIYFFSFCCTLCRWILFAHKQQHRDRQTLT